MPEQFADEIIKDDDPAEALPDAPEEQAQNPAEDGEEDFAALLEQHLPEGPKRHARGELIDATVVAIVDDAVLVSHGGKAEAAIPLHEFQDSRGETTVKPSDTIRVVVQGYTGAGPQLSYKAARAAAAQRMLEEASDAGRPVRGIVAREVRGGLVVDVGVDAFMPASQVDVLRVENLGALVGQEIEAYILELDPSKGRAVLSRRKLLAERKDKQRSETLQRLQPGQEVQGVVREVLDFGAFIDIDGVDGLLPRSEISWERSVHPSDVVKPGQRVALKILDVTAETGKVTLSRKRLEQDPWERIHELYPVGTTVSGKVMSVEEFGAFVQLQEGITGLIHAQDIAWEDERRSAKDHFKPGDQVTCAVANIEADRRRLGLSLKHLTRDPWVDFVDRYPAGSRQKGTVTRVAPFGAFVKIGEGVEGLVHVSELSWEKRINHAQEVLQEGQEVEVVVLKVDPQARRIALSYRQLSDSPIAAFLRGHQTGALATGKVTRYAPFGVFVELVPGLEGLVHISELSTENVKTPEQAVKLNEEITVKILSIEAERGRVSLSRKQALRDAERENIRQYQRQASEQEKQASGGMGLLGEALQAAKKRKK